MPSRDAMPFGAFASFSGDLGCLMGVSSIAVAKASASAAVVSASLDAESETEDSTPPSTLSRASSSSSSSGSGNAGQSARKKSPLCWWYHWLYFLSCSTKLMACGASVTEPSMTTRAISLVTPSVSES